MQIAIRFLALLAMSSTVLAQEAVQQEHSVNVVDGKSTFLREIYETGIQSRHPIAIVLGNRHQALCSVDSATDIKTSSVRDALQRVSIAAGFNLSQMNGVYTLTDSDVGPWQQEVLNYKFDVFPAYSNMTMKLLGSRLTMWIKTTFDPTSGFGASIGESTHAKKYNLGAMQSVTVQEVANRIASLEGGGIWIMRSSAPVPQRASDMEIEILPYWEEYDHDLNNFNEHELSNMICKP